MVGCRLVMAVVLWLWRQFGGCGGDHWVVVVVIFWVVVDFFFFFWLCFLFFILRCRWWMRCQWWMSVVVDVGVVAAVVEELLLLPLLLEKFNILF